MNITNKQLKAITDAVSLLHSVKLSPDGEEARRQADNVLIELEEKRQKDNKRILGYMKGRMHNV